MAHIEPLPREQLVDHEDRLAAVEQAMGFVPNSMPTMARVPGLFESFATMAFAVLRNPLISPELSQMVALMSSVGGGCRYCQAHTSHSAAHLGVAEDKLEAIWEFETSAHFTEAERAALRIALNSGQVPNAVTAQDFDEAKKHFSEDQVTAIVAVCSLFGYLNRWNDTMATSLEASPTEFANRVLAGNGWDAGKHAH